MNHATPWLLSTAILTLILHGSTHADASNGTTNLPDNGKLLFTQQPEVPVRGTARYWVVSGLTLSTITTIFLMWPRKTASILIPEPEATTPDRNVAEQFQNLANLALTRSLSLEEQMRLEKLMFQFWREELDLPNASSKALISAMFAHNEANQMMSALQRLLYSQTHPILLEPIVIPRSVGPAS